MQIFNEKEYILGAEYRDKDGKPENGSVIIKDDGPKARKILAGHRFAIVNGDVVVYDEKRPEVIEADRKERRERRRAAKIEALKVELGSKTLADMTLDDLKKIAALFATDLGIIPDPDPAE
jgi:hypothetical protein